MDNDTKTQTWRSLNHATHEHYFTITEPNELISHTLQRVSALELRHRSAESTDTQFGFVFGKQFTARLQVHATAVHKFYICRPRYCRCNLFSNESATCAMDFSTRTVSPSACEVYSVVNPTTNAQLFRPLANLMQETF